MRFRMLMIPKDYQEAGADAVPAPEMVAAMSRHNESLAKAEVLLGLEGLHPRAKAARITFSRGKHSLANGPFREVRESLGGYWMIQVRSQVEAVEWASRCPAQDGDFIEVRQVFELADFPEAVQQAAGRESALRQEVERNLRG
jgi:hypothetical protein